MIMRVAQLYFLFGIFLHVCYSEIRPREWSWNLPDNKQKLYKTNPYKAAICDYNIPKIKIVNGSISQQKCVEYQIMRQIKSKCKRDRIKLETNTVDYPHMAAVGTKSYKGIFILHCAGALISPNFVLSAYNCYIKPNQNKMHLSPTIVKLGTADIRKEYKTARTIKIKKIIKHPMQKGEDNNLALVKLNQAVVFSKFIQPACLSTVEKVDYGSISTTGWYFHHGIQKGKTKPSHVLQSGTIALPIENYSKQNNPPKTFYTDKIYISGVASYPIQTGGTLQLHFSENEKSFYILLAVLSQPGPYYKSIIQRNLLYTAIETYIDWIEDIVWPETPSNWYYWS